MNAPEEAVGLLRLPDELLLEILQLLEANDPGVFAISTSCRRLHFIALPIYLSGYGITDASALPSADLVLGPDELEVLAALQTALFIRSVKSISCSFTLNTVPAFTSSKMDNFLRGLRRLGGFLSNLERVDEITLDFTGAPVTPT
ncbi:hypothetical protein R3P38DRAFT_2952565 [Favolaschia claudopus]|uniref:F-box domain-containing protein n=1 Tax=Favolaschia claudopus TaxID=2862362 RepID=A0AAW0BFH2_9AGAR